MTLRLARIAPTRPLAKDAYKTALTFPEAWDGRKVIPVQHLGKPTYRRTAEGDWIVEWVGVPA